MTSEHIHYYAKGIIAIVGAMVTSALGLIGPDTDLFIILTVLSAGLTAAGVIFTPNGPKPGTHVVPDGDGEHRTL